MSIAASGDKKTGGSVRAAATAPVVSHATGAGPEFGALAARLGNGGLLALLRQTAVGSGTVADHAGPTGPPAAAARLSSADGPHEREAALAVEGALAPGQLALPPYRGRARRPQGQPLALPAVHARPGPGRWAASPVLPTMAATAGGGRPLPASLRDEFEARFEADFSGVRLHTDPPAASAAAALAARAYVAGPHLVFGAGQYAPATSAGRRLLAHELAHVAQQQGVLPPRMLGGRAPAGPVPAGLILRDEEPAPSAAARVDAFLRAPLPARMSASVEGLLFTPADGGQFELPDRDLTPTAIVMARLCDSRYNPVLVREFNGDPLYRVNWTFNGPGPRFHYIRMRPQGVASLLAFLEPRLGGAPAITSEQRTLVLTGEALNPVPAPILAALRRQYQNAVSVGPRGPTAPNFLAEEPEILAQLATLWWGRTQEYVRAYLTWRNDPSADNAERAAGELMDLIDAFEPHAAVLAAIHADTALRSEPAWQRLWPTGRDSQPAALERIRSSEAVAFTRYAASQPQTLLRSARTDADARRSLLRGFGAYRERELPAAAGDQPVSDAPSRYNAPPLPATMQAYPPVLPPAFAAATGATTTFFVQLRFADFFEAMGHALGGWRYRWDYLRVPNDDPGTLGLTSVAPATASDREALQTSLSRDLRYAAEDFERLGTVRHLTAALGPPGASMDSLVAANLLMDVAGSAASQLIRTASRPSSEYDVNFSGPGLYLVRCVVGPALDDQAATVAQFRRAPSVAWMPVYAQPPEAIARRRLREQGVLRSEAERRYRELDELLGRQSQPNEAELRAEYEQLRVALYGSGLEVLRAQRTQLEQERVRRAAAGGSDAALREQIDRLEQMIALRAGRNRTLGAAPLRLPATLAKDDGTVLDLLIEATRPDPAAPEWYVSDITTPNSGWAQRRGDGTLAPEYPNEDGILAALKALLESSSGYGRGRLAVQFPPGLDRPGETRGRTRTIAIRTDETGIVLHGVQSVTTLASVAAVVAAPFTGGASLTLLMPVGVIGALPSAYRIVHRGQMGTLRFDMETALAVVDIATAVLNVGEIGAGLRAAATAGTRAGLRWAVVEGSLWIVGVGGNGLGMLLMGADLLEQIHRLDGLPPGLRSARITELLGNAMLQIGIQAGAHLASSSHLRTVETSVRTAAAAADLPGAAVHAPVPATAPPPARATGRSAPPPELHAALPGDLAGRLDVDPRLHGNTVRVEYRLGSNGRVDADSIRMVAAPGAGGADIAAHVEAARTLRAYAGLLGAVHDVLEQLRGALQGHRRPAQGSAGWEAQLELAKLRDLMQRRLRELSRLPDDSPRHRELVDDFANLADQLHEMQLIVGGFSDADPQGFIAARSVADRRRANAQLMQEHGVRSVMREGDQYVVAARTADATTDPAPDHVLYFRDGRLVVRRLHGAGGAERPALLTAIEHDGQWYLVPRDYAGEPVAEGARTLRLEAPRSDFEARRLRAASEPEGDAALRNAALEAALTAAGLPDTPQQRALLRRWGPVLTALGELQARSLGRNLPSVPEVAAEAVARLMRGSADGGYIEARYDDFRRLIRETAIAAILGVPAATLRDVLPAEWQARTPAEQMRAYRDLYAALPEPGDKGELWTRYREVRSRLDAARGGFDFAPLLIGTRLLRHTEHTEIDGAIHITALLGAGGPPAGRYALESKGGSSYKPDQARRYSEHLHANDGHAVLAAGDTALAGVVYFFDSLSEARTVVRDLDRHSRHPHIYVLYVDAQGQVQPLARGAGVPAAAGSGTGSGGPR